MNFSIKTFYTTQKMKLSIKGFFSKFYQIRRFLRIYPSLLKESLMKNFIFCAVLTEQKRSPFPVYNPDIFPYWQ